MRRCLAFLLALLSPLLASGAVLFTNIVLPGTNFPATQWWTNAVLPDVLWSTNAWLAVNENMRRASNAFVSLQGLTNGYPWTNVSVAQATLAATASAGWPTTWAISAIVTPGQIITNGHAAAVTISNTVSATAFYASDGGTNQVGPTVWTNGAGAATITASGANGNLSMIGALIASGLSGTFTNAIQNVAVQVITAGTTTYTPTGGMKKCLVICVGGGGGAAAATAADDAQSGGGGGGCAIRLFTAAEIGASQTCVVGAASNTTGNTSGLGTANALLQATGGAAGAAQGNLTVGIVAGGAGGVGTLGDININGGAGGPGLTLSTSYGIGGTGGCSIFGGGGAGKGSTAQGTAGTAYGGGAGGGHTSDGTDLNAVNGAAGVIYVIEFL